MTQPVPSHTPDSAAPTWTVGDLLVRRVDEVALPPQTGSWLLPAATPDIVNRTPWLQPHFATPDGVLHLASHSFAFEVNGLRVLVDTGIGNGKTRANPAWHNLDTAYLQRLTDAGFAPESVDLVILTHLHTDHVGWNTRNDGGTWVPTFPNARYLTSRTEWDYWADVDMEEARKQMFHDSVHPIRDAGLLDLADVPGTGAVVAPGVRLLPTPGHTPGQIAVGLRSAGQSAVITGDCVHHPVQLRHPDITSCVDSDATQAARTRRELLAALADTETLLLGSHFPPPTAGLVVSEGRGYRLVPTPGTVTSS
ncbi:MBL fold metallo-hydrolase [Kitasatospora sp. GP82]|uniref:MBL fold metallo-hydrolase n=1 Tax=Kitasatospora sp. GP82 TaxID=3035089 RepID=UPI002473C02D|nr:MBL fold metallo-hydrolase [Kitasatospora sp. GP82]MDH6128051.1 glyoxylase-like metal-dependent hydrolase (beta-lactamase superfamily II) [Kitasatospora sp. GP82]